MIFSYMLMDFSCFVGNIVINPFYQVLVSNNNDNLITECAHEFSVYSTVNHRLKWMICCSETSGYRLIKNF